jgi:hypothetical protein
MDIRIDTYNEFKRSIVEPDFHELIADWGNLRKAWHCAGSLFHLADWVYEAHKSSIDKRFQFIDDNGQTRPVSNSKEFANSLGQTHQDFQLIRDIANAAKHFRLFAVPPGRPNPPDMPGHSANTYATVPVFDPLNFDPNAFDIGEVKLQGKTKDISFATLAQSVLDMWNQLFATESW